MKYVFNNKFGNSPKRLMRSGVISDVFRMFDEEVQFLCYIAPDQGEFIKKYHDEYREFIWREKCKIVFDVYPTFKI